MEKIDRLRMLIREDDAPFFTDEELDFYLIENGGNVERTAYDLLILKSENTGLKVSGLTTDDTSKFFLRLAQKYRPINSGILGGA